jgi:membrane associated rhomboid family serine protease
VTVPMARATNALALLTGGAFLLSLLAGNGEALDMMAGFVPARFLGVQIPDALPAWITPLTATLLHGGWLHLAFNMLMLLFCGRMVEAVVGLPGLLLLYVIGAYAAALGQYLLDPASLSPMIGASGAISAVFGAYALLFGKPRLLLDHPRAAVLVNIVWLAAAWVGVQFLMGFAFSGMGMAIAVGAHVGGFIAGLAIAPLLTVRRNWQFA